MALNIRTVFLYVSVSIFFIASIYHILLPINSISPNLLRLSSPSNHQFYLPNLGNNLISHEQDATTTATAVSVTGQPPEGSTNSIGFNAEGTIPLEPRKPNDPIEIEIEGTTVLSNATTIATARADGENFDSDCENDSISMCASPVEAADSLNLNVSVLFPAWEALVVVSMADEDDDKKNYTSYFCLFDTNEISPARFSGTLRYPDRKTFACEFPKRVRRRLPFRQPLLTRTPEKYYYNRSSSPSPEILRWNFIVYDVIQTENDVVLLSKGINNRQGINRSPTEFKCVFGDDAVNGVTTSVTSSMQEVFRCQRPDLTALSQHPIKTSLLILQTNQLLPSIAYYTPQRKIASTGGKSLLCACTMVYNVAKFLKEWVVYHSKIGVDKFILYDNGSDDDLGEVVNSLRSRGYDVETRFWLWPKTQEAGFSHAALHAKNSCHWMMYIDVDEFVYSPLWASSQPSKLLLPSLLPSHPHGQLVIKCYEFGPSGQDKHPPTGVTQGYNCRKEAENRHKSIVLLDAIHDSLLNVIHHFKLRDGYKTKKVGVETMVVNHYKFQAWPEFKAKFRRRVSAYVVDWTRSVNLRSNDRTPGLGNRAVEPDGWAEMFCEVYDDRLKELTSRWFTMVDERSEFRMAWQI